MEILFCGGTQWSRKKIVMESLAEGNALNKRLKKQNSGNQPEFQSSIKKRTVNQTVVALKLKYLN